MIPAQGSRVNTEYNKMSYKGIAPILHGGGEPYPNPNAFNFCTGIFFERLVVTCTYCVVCSH